MHFRMNSFVLSTAPNRQMVNDFKKPPSPEVFCMPLWTERIENHCTLFCSADWMAPSFRSPWWNPSTRLWRYADWEILQAACYQCQPDECIKIIGFNSTIYDQVVHSLVHMTSVDPFTESNVALASETALKTIVEIKGYEARRRMEELFASWAGNPLTTALNGYYSNCIPSSC